jgi:hypothetical protein
MERGGEEIIPLTYPKPIQSQVCIQLHTLSRWRQAFQAKIKPKLWNAVVITL